jgi:B12-binding domain/radical SAM domain protein
VFLHPPSVYDFRNEILFSGPVARTVVPLTSVYLCIPIGALSMVEYVERHGYNVKITNMAENMVTKEDFDVEKHIKNIDSKIFGIGLHWCVHSQGAIELAKICKKYHPNSLVILGGLTATIFDKEILQNNPSVDMIIRGEGEEALLSLLKAYSREDYSQVNNLTYRRNSKIVVNEMKKPCDNLDDYNFTKLDLLDVKDKMLQFGNTKYWHIPLCRGCVYNCITCGGSQYSYKKYLNRDKIALRSPEKVIEDLNHLIEQNVRSVFIFQDMRICGEKYSNKLVDLLHKEKIDLENITIELFQPASKTFIKKLSTIPANLIYLTLSPESGVNEVRKAYGRDYTNDDLLKFIENIRDIQSKRLILSTFFMIGLSYQSEDTLRETWKFWDKILTTNTVEYEDFKLKLPKVVAEFDIMTYLDPGSLAFDYPEKYGYRLNFNNFTGYQQGMLNPSWKYWFSYETMTLNRDNLPGLIFDSWEELVKLYKKHGLMEDINSEIELKKIKLNKIIVNELDEILRIEDSNKMKKRLNSFRDEVVSGRPLKASWRYKKRIKKVIRNIL